MVKSTIYLKVLSLYVSQALFAKIQCISYAGDIVNIRNLAELQRYLQSEICSVYILNGFGC